VIHAEPRISLDQLIDWVRQNEPAEKELPVTAGDQPERILAGASRDVE
jgi:hypothetical protein